MGHFQFQFSLNHQRHINFPRSYPSDIHSNRDMLRLDIDACLVLASVSGLASEDLAGCPCIAGWHIERRIPHEEVSRAQQQGHRLRRHDGVIFWRREVRDAESVPEHNVFVIDLLGGIGFDPLRQSHRRLSRGLGNVAASRVDLVIGV